MNIIKEIRKFPGDFSGALRMNRTQALIWLTCWWCWTLASMQFYLLPYTMTSLAEDLHVSTSKISEANTTSMLSRTIGAAIFGILSDQHGRKTPIMVNLVLLGVFTLCSGFVHTYGQFVGVRLLFGIVYGGIYGANMAAVLEAVPAKARGAVAGFTQQGFGAGNMLASGFHLAMNPYSWRALYYLGAGLTLSAIVLRIVTPFYSTTTPTIRDEQGREEVDERAAVGGNIKFLVKFHYALRHHWPIFIYCTVLSACFNTLGHGHMDVYPTFLETQRGLSVLHETWITVILQSGGVLGGIIGGYLSKYSPKWVPAIFTIMMAPFLPLLLLPQSWHLLALGAFFFEFCYGAAIGTLGNILQMVCPHPGIRGAFGGVVYNLGNAISSIAPTVETILGEDFPLSDGAPDYGRTILILAGIMIGLLTVTLACMPTKKVDMDWDLMDPNQVIPDREAPARSDCKAEADSRMVRSFAVDIDSGEKGDKGRVQHLEGRA